MGEQPNGPNRHHNFKGNSGVPNHGLVWGLTSVASTDGFIDNNDATGYGYEDLMLILPFILLLENDGFLVVCLNMPLQLKAYYGTHHPSTENPTEIFR